jgi:hypothetical protein
MTAPRTVVVCANPACGKSFVRMQNGPRKFCSKVCRETHPTYIANRRRQLARWKQKHPDRRVENLRRIERRKARRYKYCVPDWGYEEPEPVKHPRVRGANCRTPEETRQAYADRARKRIAAVKLLRSMGIIVPGETKDQQRHVALRIVRQMGVQL